MFLHDALVPLMGVVVLLRGGVWRKLSGRCAFLTAFLVLGLLFLPTRGFADVYEWSVFAYMAVLFLFFSEISLSPRRCLQVFLGLLGLCLGGFLYELLPFPTLFSFVSPQMKDTAMPFLARRFAFTQGNPNLFALYLAIPCALLVRWIHSQDWSMVPLRKRLVLFPAFLAIMLPVLSSASKHGILPLALLASCLPTVFPAWSRFWKAAVVVIVLLLAAVFETTVLFTVFPVTRQGINTSSGMYFLHQSVYFRMLEDTPSMLIMGAGQSKIHELYPRFADHGDIAATLQRYNAMASYQDFCTFMDPHNEYLNLCALFGLPALLAMLCFWSLQPGFMPAKRRFTGALFVCAIFACCLWDDVLSKRAVWLAAAICLNPWERNTSNESSIS